MTRTTQILLFLGLVVFCPLLLWMAMAFWPYPQDYRRLCGSTVFLAGLFSLFLGAWLPGVRTILGLTLAFLGAIVLTSDVLWENVVQGFTWCWLRQTVPPGWCWGEAIPYPNGPLLSVPVAVWIVINAFLFLNRAGWRAFVGVNLIFFVVLPFLGRACFPLPPW